MDPANTPTAFAIFACRQPRGSRRIRPHASAKQRLPRAVSRPEPEVWGEGAAAEEVELAVAMASLSLTAMAAATTTSPSIGGRRRRLRVAAMAAQKPKPKTTAGTTRRSGTTTVFPVGEPAPTASGGGKGKAPVRLLTNVERLRLLTKAERAGLLSAAERAGLSLSAVERLGLLSKAEELGALSAASDPATPGALLSLAAPLLAAGPAVAYLVPEEHAWQVALQAAVALVSVVGGAAAVAASSFVSRLQGSSSSS